MTRSLIIGAAGQDGTLLIDELISSGHDVLGTSRSCYSDPHIAQLDLYDEVAVLDLLFNFMPDEIYVLSGQSSVGQSFSSFRETLSSFTDPIINIFNSCVKLSIKPRILIPLSSEMFGENAINGACESTSFDLLSPYAFAKKACHDLCEYYKRHNNFDIVYLYLFNHESPLRPVNYVTAKVSHGAVACASGALSKLELGNVQIYRDWGWASEYVKAMRLALGQGSHDSYIIATGSCCSLEDFVRVCFDNVDLDYKEFVTFSDSLHRPSDISRNFGIPSRAENDLGWVAKYKMPDVAHLLVRHYADLDAK